MSYSKTIYSSGGALKPGFEAMKCGGQNDGQVMLQGRPQARSYPG
jgi:hypothetical protein